MPKATMNSALGCLTSLDVRYYETDMMGISHHSNYIRWFEVARTEYLRAAGMTYRSLEDMGLGCPVIGARCRYLHPSRYDDHLTIQAWVTNYTGVRLFMAYQIWHEDLLICDGETDHAFVYKGRPVSLSRSLPEVHAGMLACLERDRQNL